MFKNSRIIAFLFSAAFLAALVGCTEGDKDNSDESKLYTAILLQGYGGTLSSITYNVKVATSSGQSKEVKVALYDDLLCTSETSTFPTTYQKTLKVFTATDPDNDGVAEGSDTVQAYIGESLYVGLNGSCMGSGAYTFKKTVADGGTPAYQVTINGVTRQVTVE